MKRALELISTIAIVTSWAMSPGCGKGIPEPKKKDEIEDVAPPGPPLVFVHPRNRLRVEMDTDCRLTSTNDVLAGFTCGGGLRIVLWFRKAPKGTTESNWLKEVERFDKNQRSEQTTFPGGITYLRLGKDGRVMSLEAWSFRDGELVSCSATANDRFHEERFRAQSMCEGALSSK